MKILIFTFEVDFIPISLMAVEGGPTNITPDKSEQFIFS